MRTRGQHPRSLKHQGALCAGIVGARSIRSCIQDVDGARIVVAANDDQAFRMPRARQPCNNVEGGRGWAVAVNKRIKPDLQARNSAELAEDPVPSGIYTASCGRGGRTTVARSERLQGKHAVLNPAGTYTVHDSA